MKVFGISFRCCLYVVFNLFLSVSIKCCKLSITYDGAIAPLENLFVILQEIYARHKLATVHQSQIEFVLRIDKLSQSLLISLLMKAN